MKVLDDLLGVLDYNATVKDIRQGVFHTGVVTRECGLAATLPWDALKQDQRPLVREPGLLSRKNPEDLARLVYSDRLLEAAVGMAAVNSLLEVDPSACREINAAEIIMEKGAGRNVAVIGHFPFIDRLRPVAANLWVIEKNPAEGDHPETRAESLLPRADVVAVTGTTLTNHTFDRVMSFCQPGSFRIMLGDTTPLAPLLFDYGLHVLAGTRVLDPDLALACVSQGATFRQIKGVVRLAMSRQ